MTERDGPADEFGWVAGWSGLREFEVVPDFREPPPEVIQGAPDYQPAAVAEPVAARPKGSPRAKRARSASARPAKASTAPRSELADPLSVVASLDAALAAASLAPEFGAAVTLARVLAAGVDAGKLHLAPKLLSVMAALGLAPARSVAARAAVPVLQDDEHEESEGGAGAAVLARIRARRKGEAVPHWDPASAPGTVPPLPTARSTRKGSTTPRVFTPPAVTGEPGPCGCGCALTPATSKGFEVVEFAACVLGIAVLPWQRWLFIHALELDLWGGYRFRTILCLVARQNGKTTALSVLALWRMLCDGARMVLGTSTNLDYAKEAWEKCVSYAEDTPALAGEFVFTGRGAAVRRENSSTQLKGLNKARYKTAAANRKGGRSMSVDLLILDELREHQTWAAWSASSKTTNARPDGQKWAITNQGDRTSVVLNHLRAAALAGLGLGVEPEVDADPDEIAEQLALGDDTLGLFEWSASDKCALDDVEEWANANPALGYTMSQATIASDMRTDSPEVFRTEVMCQRVDQLDAAIDMDAWADGTDEAATMTPARGRVSLCIDVDPSGGHVTLVGAALMSDGRVQTAVVDSWSGPNAVQEARAALPAWRATIKPRAFGWFPGGPAAALAADLTDDKKATALTDAPAVCLGLAQQITGRLVRHNGDPLLRAQLAGAGKLLQGDRWRFVRLGGPSVDAAYALAGAVHLARTIGSTKSIPGVRYVG